MSMTLQNLEAVVGTNDVLAVSETIRFGILFVGTAACAAVGAYLGPRIEKRLGMHPDDLTALKLRDEQAQGYLSERFDPMSTEAQRRAGPSSMISGYNTMIENTDPFDWEECRKLNVQREFYVRKLRKIASDSSK